MCRIQRDCGEPCHYRKDCYAGFRSPGQYHCDPVIPTKAHRIERFHTRKNLISEILVSERLVSRGFNGRMVRILISIKNKFFDSMRLRFLVAFFMKKRV